MTENIVCYNFYISFQLNNPDHITRRKISKLLGNYTKGKNNFSESCIQYYFRVDFRYYNGLLLCDTASRAGTVVAV